MTEAKKQEEVLRSRVTSESCVGRRKEESMSSGNDRDGAAMLPYLQQETQGGDTGGEDPASLAA